MERLTKEEFIEHMQKHSCPNCPVGDTPDVGRKDECNDCYLIYIIDVESGGRYKL